jgi:hypothetical protein
MKRLAFLYYHRQRISSNKNPSGFYAFYDKIAFGRRLAIRDAVFLETSRQHC